MKLDVFSFYYSVAIKLHPTQLTIQTLRLRFLADPAVSFSVTIIKAIAFSNAGPLKISSPRIVARRRLTHARFGTIFLFYEFIKRMIQTLQKSVCHILQNAFELKIDTCAKRLKFLLVTRFYQHGLSFAWFSAKQFFEFDSCLSFCFRVTVASLFNPFTPGTVDFKIKKLI